MHQLHPRSEAAKANKHHMRLFRSIQPSFPPLLERRRTIKTIWSGSSNFSRTRSGTEHSIMVSATRRSRNRKFFSCAVKAGVKSSAQCPGERLRPQKALMVLALIHISISSAVASQLATATSDPVCEEPKEESTSTTTNWWSSKLVAETLTERSKTQWSRQADASTTILELQDQGQNYALEDPKAGVVRRRVGTSSTGGITATGNYRSRIDEELTMFKERKGVAIGKEDEAKERAGGTEWKRKAATVLTEGADEVLQQGDRFVRHKTRETSEECINLYTLVRTAAKTGNGLAEARTELSQSHRALVSALPATLFGQQQEFAELSLTKSATGEGVGAASMPLDDDDRKRTRSAVAEKQIASSKRATLLLKSPSRPRLEACNRAQSKAVEHAESKKQLTQAGKVVASGEEAVWRKEKHYTKEEKKRMQENFRIVKATKPSRSDNCIAEEETQLAKDRERKVIVHEHMTKSVKNTNQAYSERERTGKDTATNPTYKEDGGYEGTRQQDNVRKEGEKTGDGNQRQIMQAIDKASHLSNSAEHIREQGHVFAIRWAGAGGTVHIVNPPQSNIASATTSQQDAAATAALQQNKAVKGAHWDKRKPDDVAVEQQQRHRRKMSRAGTDAPAVTGICESDRAKENDVAPTTEHTSKSMKEVKSLNVKEEDPDCGNETRVAAVPALTLQMRDVKAGYSPPLREAESDAAGEKLGVSHSRRKSRNRSLKDCSAATVNCIVECGRDADAASCFARDVDGASGTKKRFLPEGEAQSNKIRPGEVTFPNNPAEAKNSDIVAATSPSLNTIRVFLAIAQTADDTAEAREEQKKRQVTKAARQSTYNEKADRGHVQGMSGIWTLPSEVRVLGKRPTAKSEQQSMLDYAGLFKEKTAAGVSAGTTGRKTQGRALTADTHAEGAAATVLDQKATEREKGKGVMEKNAHNWKDKKTKRNGVNVERDDVTPSSPQARNDIGHQRLRMGEETVLQEAAVLVSQETTTDIGPGHKKDCQKIFVGVRGRDAEEKAVIKTTHAAAVYGRGVQAQGCHGKAKVEWKEAAEDRRMRANERGALSDENERAAKVRKLEAEEREAAAERRETAAREKEEAAGQSAATAEANASARAEENEAAAAAELTKTEKDKETTEGIKERTAEQTGREVGEQKEGEGVRRNGAEDDKKATAAAAKESEKAAPELKQRKKEKEGGAEAREATAALKEAKEEKKAVADRGEVAAGRQLSLSRPTPQSGPAITGPPRQMEKKKQERSQQKAGGAHIYSTSGLQPQQVEEDDAAVSVRKTFPYQGLSRGEEDGHRHGVQYQKDESKAHTYQQQSTQTQKTQQNKTSALSELAQIMVRNDQKWPRTLAQLHNGRNKQTIPFRTGSSSSDDKGGQLTRQQSDYGRRHQGLRLVLASQNSEQPIERKGRLPPEQGNQIQHSLHPQRQQQRQEQQQNREMYLQQDREQQQELEEQRDLKRWQNAEKEQKLDYQLKTEEMLERKGQELHWQQDLKEQQEFKQQQELLEQQEVKEQQRLIKLQELKEHPKQHPKQEELHQGHRLNQHEEKQQQQEYHKQLGHRQQKQELKPLSEDGLESQHKYSRLQEAHRKRPDLPSQETLQQPLMLSPRHEQAPQKKLLHKQGQQGQAEIEQPQIRDEQPDLPIENNPQQELRVLEQQHGEEGHQTSLSLLEQQEGLTYAEQVEQQQSSQHVHQTLLAQQSETLSVQHQPRPQENSEQHPQLQLEIDLRKQHELLQQHETITCVPESQKQQISAVRIRDALVVRKDFMQRRRAAQALLNSRIGTSAVEIKGDEKRKQEKTIGDRESNIPPAATEDESKVNLTLTERKALRSSGEAVRTSLEVGGKNILTRAAEGGEKQLESPGEAEEEKRPYKMVYLDAMKGTIKDLPNYALWKTVRENKTDVQATTFEREKQRPRSGQKQEQPKLAASSHGTLRSERIKTLDSDIEAQLQSTEEIVDQDFKSDWLGVDSWADFKELIHAISRIVQSKAYEVLKEARWKGEKFQRGKKRDVERSASNIAEEERASGTS